MGESVAAVLDDLGIRFLLNIPLEEQSDAIRVCFQSMFIVHVLGV